MATAAGEWTTGLFNCHEDPASCFGSFFCPCVIVGRIADIVSDGDTKVYTELHSIKCTSEDHAFNNAKWIYCIIEVLSGCGCLYHARFRSRLRQKYSLPETYCADSVATFCCECCTAAQEYRELKNRGWDPALGYHRNMEKMEGSAPVIEGVSISAVDRSNSQSRNPVNGAPEEQRMD